LADDRFRKFHLSEIKERGYKLDITWLKDDSLEDSDDLPEPQDLASEAITELEAVVDDLREIVRAGRKRGSHRKMISPALIIPKGLCPLAPGCEERATLGWSSLNITNPEWVA